MAMARRQSATRLRPEAEPEHEQEHERETGRQEARRSSRARLYMIALALQYGAQPLLSKRCTGSSSEPPCRGSYPSLASSAIFLFSAMGMLPVASWKGVIMTTTVLSCEIVKVFCAVLLLKWGGSLRVFLKHWSLRDALQSAALPALLYAVQNTLLQLSYSHLDALTFSLLNQTKLVFTALFMFLFLGFKQSAQQVFALVLLLCAAAILSVGQSTPHASPEANPERVIFLGIIPLLAASVLSGLASTLCQWAAQVKKKDTYLMTIEMSTFGSIGLVLSTLRSPDGHAIRKRGFFSGWTRYTLIPIFTNAIGGILVGLVTTHSGGVKKGFVIVSALLVTALLQYLFDGIAPSPYVTIALPLVVISTVIHQRYPHKNPKND